MPEATDALTASVKGGGSVDEHSSEESDSTITATQVQDSARSRRVAETIMNRHRGRRQQN